jgi:photosystem II stability/assembly factor-like uncharacterized protein
MRRTWRNLILVPSFILLSALTAGQSGRADAQPWQPVYGPYGGSVAALALSPNYSIDHTVFAGLRGQGVYRTTDGGDSWQQISPSGWVVVALIISPAYATDQTVFVTVGLPTAGYDVYRSTDEGSSWQDVTPDWSVLPHAPGLAISSNFAADKTVYILAGSQTYLSNNGGDTFVQAGGWFETHEVVDLAFSPAYATDQTLFALVQDEGLLKSTDGGAIWNPTGLSGSLSTFAVSPDYANDQTLIAASRSNGLLYLSMDGGDTWTTPGVTLSLGGEHTLLFSPTFATDRIVLAASSADPGPYRSIDGGTIWSPVGWYDPDKSFLRGFVAGGVFALALAPHTAYDAAAFAGTSCGIYRSNNWGDNWYQDNDGLAHLTVRTLAVAPGEPSTLLAGTSFFEHLRVDTTTLVEYDGNLQLSIDGGQSWQDVSGRLDRVQSVGFSPGFATDRTAFAATGTVGQHGFYDGGVYRSTDGGQNWSEVLDGRAYMALALSPNLPTDRTLWVSAFTYSSALGLYVSTDGGDTWTSLASSVHAQALVPSPNYAVDQTLFAGTHDSGLQMSTDGGASWTGVLTSPVTALAVSPAYGASRTLYAGVQESPSTPGEIYCSTDGGETWQRLDTGIPVTWQGNPATVSVLTFASDGSVLVGISYGSEAGDGAVYRSVDGGETWQPLGSGLNASNVFALATLPGRSLSFYAGADGGLWHVEVPQDSGAEPGKWESHGPRGGKAQALAVSPDFVNDGVAFSGSWLSSGRGGESGLGILKSTDGGQTWQSSASGTEGISYGSAIHGYAFSPDFAADRIVFAATWGGLFKSTDGGENWKWLVRLYSGPPGSITAISVAPDYADSGHVLAGGGWGGLYQSWDGGVNWTANYDIAASAAVAHSPNFASDGIAFAAGGYDGLNKTSDGGMSWTQVLTPSVSALAVSPQFETDSTVFCGGDALYISSDGGTTWISTTVALDALYIKALAISPALASDQTLFAGTSSGLYQSSNGGFSWQPVVNYPGPAVQSLAISPGWPEHPLLLVGTTEGVYRTADGGATWTRSDGLATLSTSPLAHSPGVNLLLAGASNHGLYGSNDGGESWFPLGLQGGTWYYTISDVAISPAYAADQTIFAAWTSGVSIGGNIYRTTDGGATWERVYSTDYVGALAISPQYAADQTIYATGNSGRVLCSSDGGATWSPAGDWAPDVYGAATQVALPPNYPADSTVFAAGSQGFWRLSPGATTWEPVASGLDADVYVTSLAVSPNYAADETLLATASWYLEPGGNHYHGIFCTTDGGLNWELANTGLPNTTMRHVAFSPNYAADHTAYATSEDQLYRSSDGGASWTAVGVPPELPGLYDLIVNGRGDVHVASSLGVWRYTTSAWNALVNGNFEADSGWDLLQTPRPAGFSDRVAYTSKRSLRIGIDNGSNVYAYSSARQVVTVPADTISATLSFYVYPVSGNPAVASQRQVFRQNDTGSIQPASPVRIASGDAQYLLVLEPSGTAIWETLFWDLSNAQSWQHHTLDLTSYAGQTILLHFGVYNDGAGGRTGMYIDNASLVIERPAPAELTPRQYLPLILQDHARPALSTES